MRWHGKNYVDWFGYSASVSPYILKQFEQEVGYKFRPEFIIDQGYMNNTYRIPSKEFKISRLSRDGKWRSLQRKW